MISRVLWRVWVGGTTAGGGWDLVPVEREAGCLVKVSTKGGRDGTEKDGRKTRADVDSAADPLQRELLRWAGMGSYWYLK